MMRSAMQKCLDPEQNLLQGSFGDALHKTCASNTPIKTFDMVGQDDALRFQRRREQHLERVPFLFASNGTEENKANLHVV